MDNNHIYACIDLKSFYASVECVERGLDPMTTNLVVADKERTEKTICLAVSPALKSYGLSGRARLYEVLEKVRKINCERMKINKNKPFISKSYNNQKIKLNSNLELDFIIATPRMRLYMEYSAKIYNIYLKYVSEEDLFSYSIDEVFCDITNYLKFSKLTKEAFVTKIIKDIYTETGITATGGIGTNLYLAKVAMDIVAKHVNANNDNVRIAFLDEKMYREKLWNHVPLTDFWQIGKGYANRLNALKIYTMGDLCLYSLQNENKLYQVFGVNAEILIDHAWGYEPCTLFDIKNYRPLNSSVSSSQVLPEPYDYLKARLIVYEMIELLSLNLVRKNLVSDEIVLTIGYDIENLNNYKGEVSTDFYGRKIPKHAHGTVRLPYKTASTKMMMKKVGELYDKIIDTKLSVRRITLSFGNLSDFDLYQKERTLKQIDFFSSQDNDVINKKNEESEKNVQKTVVNLKKKYGPNAILRGMNLQKGAKTVERNKQIGGHRA